MKNHLLTRKKAEKEIKTLKNKILRYNKAYYQDALPLTSDFEYDQLAARLGELEAKYPDLREPDSPSQRVGEKPFRPFMTVKHLSRMLSLDNTYSQDEVHKFHQRVLRALECDEVEYMLELKIDGAAVSFQYENRKLARVLTRGDGINGDDITRNILELGNVVKTLPEEYSESPLELRGEIFMTKENFIKLNEERIKNSKIPFVNPRNAAAGSMKLLDPSLFSKRRLQYFIHSTGHTNALPVKKQSELMDHLEKNKFPVNPYRLTTRKITEIFQWADEMEQKRKKLPYDIDGIVMKINDFNIRRVLGATQKSPRWAVAYKFSADQAQTRLKRVVYQVGRTGVITPVAELEPVFLAGSTVKRSTLHNADEIKRLDLRSGDTVYLKKGGDIIPRIVGVNKSIRTGKEKEIVFPSRCPVCHTNIIYLEDDIKRACPGLTCPAQKERRISYFASRKIMDIEHLGPENIKKLIRVAKIKDPADLYTLKNKKEVLKRLLDEEGFGAKMLENLLVSIEKSKNRTFEHVLAGLGIPGAGERMSDYLAKRFKNIKTLMNLDVEELALCPGIGEKIAENIVKYFLLRDVKKLVEKFSAAGLQLAIKTDTEDNSNRALEGKRAVITGTLPTLTRNQAEEMIRRAGGEVLGAVTRKTNLLVAGYSPGSKLQLAKKLDIEIMPGEEFEKSFKDLRTESSTGTNWNEDKERKSIRKIISTALL